MGNQIGTHMQRTIIFALTFLFIGCGSETDAETFDPISSTNNGCVLTPCHGLNLQCVEAREDMVCDAMYALGDNCRSFASCEKVHNKCTLSLTPTFNSCKLCIEKCEKDHPNNPMEAFQCEATCEH